MGVHILQRLINLRKQLKPPEGGLVLLICFTVLIQIVIHVSDQLLNHSVLLLSFDQILRVLLLPALSLDVTFHVVFESGWLLFLFFEI